MRSNPYRSTDHSFSQDGQRTAVQTTPLRTLQFWRGGSTTVQMAYETWGELNGDGTNAVLVLPGLSPDTHAASSNEDPSAGWWESIIGPGRPVDSRSFFIIAVNHLGSCFGSSGPASLGEDNVPLGLRFPDLTMEDLAAGASFVLDDLGIDRVQNIVAPSMGGLVALAFMLRYPNRFERSMLIASAARAEAQSIAIHSLQRDAIRNDPNWQAGNYNPNNPPTAGMRLARKIGMTSYRSALEWESRFTNQKMVAETDEPFGYEFEVERYLEAIAERFVHRFDANAYLYLSRAMDWFDAANHGSDLRDALSRIGPKQVDIVGISTDTLFPLRQQESLKDALQKAGVNARLHVVNSSKGHDAFLVDTKQFGPLISQFLTTPRSKRLSAVC